MQGWDEARKNPAAAAKTVLANDTTGAQTEKHQTRMMGEIAKLLATDNGKLDPRAVPETAESGIPTRWRI